MKQELPDFSALVETHYRGLYRFAYSLARDEHEASDLVQQTFLVWAKKGAELRDPAKAKSWLFTTLYREFLRQRRRAGYTAVHDEALLEAEAPAVAPEVVERLDDTKALEALDELDECYRAPLTLFYLQDLSYREIAEILNVPIGTVMSRLSRGKALLKRSLAEKPSP